MLCYAGTADQQGTTMSDPKSQLEVLRALRPTIGDPVQAAAIDALMAQAPTKGNQ
jgi:hypothetical protein